ncbi:transglutaminase family protein [Qipengyuania sp. 1NDH17]|uniref:Transglutaminase family protein n=1 Tax=Qipengyuania polymorpha TaxID=2867234 RepID=A0ABS7IWI7_9SPHN|nr:transglutaminase family protein [Qipengyuania polymorpha]MBX7457896.1 transglutaminase family protein [Qipengyuania polymorpha]
MRLSIRHTTRYRFDNPVVHALQRLRLTPKETQGQEILEWEMEYENAHEELTYEDQHHNTTTLVGVEPETTEVTITCRGKVDTSDQAGVIGRHAGHLPLWSFLSQTRLTRPGPGMKKLIADLEKHEGERLDMLHELSRSTLDRVDYQVGKTNWKTTAEEAYAAKNGVCQDHAHIFIGAARALDVPARYVSGYLMMNDRIEQEATHAWAEAYVEGLGWVGFDISNGISPDERYVRVATGRDYRDASPVTGISFGNTSQMLEVDVEVEQQQVQQQ